MKGIDKKDTPSSAKDAGLGQGMAKEEPSAMGHERTKKAWLDAEKRFRVIFDGSWDALMILDSDSGHILDINPAAHRLLGYGAHSLRGRHFSTLFPPASDLSLKGLRESLKAHGAVLTERFLRADGSTWLMDLTSTVIPWNGQDAILTTLRDISDRIQAEKEKAQLEAQLRQAHKL
ncbi:MAG: PAS domain S-box protein, partial [Thermodesulfobacteriota bacterium]|nr:PAS domain S-box protein [Thermodesulfobacteriota bacterium]